VFKSESLAELAKALSKAQGAMKNAKKDSDNPFFKSKYADLASVSDACREELAANGLAVVQLPTMREGKMVLEYVLLHASGEFIGSELEMTPVKSDPQGIGSAITYARRYSLGGVTGVATEDDDGNAASGNGNKQAERPQQSKPQVTFKRESAAPKNGEGGKPQEGNSPPAAAEKDSSSERTTTGPGGGVQMSADTEPPPLEYCTREQQDWLRLQFKDALPAKFKKDADGLRRDWLKQMHYVKDDKGTSTMIPRHEFKAIAKRCIEYASTFSI